MHVLADIVFALLSKIIYIFVVESYYTAYSIMTHTPNLTIFIYIKTYSKILTKIQKRKVKQKERRNNRACYVDIPI